MAVSKSPINGVEYTIPANTDDSVTLNAFVKQHAGKQVVVVQGLGFVGSVNSLVVANALSGDYAVIGIDLPTPGSYWKVAGINSGEFPVTTSDPEVARLFIDAQRQGNLIATSDDFAYSLADIVLIDINLDVQKREDGFGVELDGFKAGLEAIARNSKEDVLVLVESTVPPGTCQKVVHPIFESIFKERGLQPNFLIGHSYERVTPGPNYVDSIRNFYRVYSGLDEASATAVQTFLETIINVADYPLTRLADTNATEIAKVLENSYRAMNIAFVQEWTEFAEHSGVNLFEVISAIKMRPTHANLMRPGLGVGGYCLTKDPLLASWAAQSFFDAPKLVQSEEAVRINDSMPLHSFKRIEQLMPEGLKDKKVLLLGVSYLNDVGDTRYTPVAPLFDQLLQAGADITLHDPFVPYWEERQLNVETDAGQVIINDYDVVAICTAHTEYQSDGPVHDFILGLKGKIIVDTWGILPTASLVNLSGDNQVIAIGRGDIK